MAAVCLRCALRLRIAESRLTNHRKRTFSSTSAVRQKQVLPKFTPTSQPELDNVLASLRNKHLLPGILSDAERALIYKPKYIKQLTENRETVTLSDGEEIRLEHINRLTDVPSLTRDILPKAIEMMAKGEPADWDQLPAMLAGLKRAKMTPEYKFMGKICRKAIEAGRFSIILQCLQQAEKTEMRLSKPEILSNVLYALRKLAMHDGWSEQSTARAMRDAQSVAILLEDKAHGTGAMVKPGGQDPRTKPEVLGVFLELSAVFAVKHRGGRDDDGMVRVYSERLLGNMLAIKRAEETSQSDALERMMERLEISKDEAINVRAGMQARTTTPRETGPQVDVLRGVPIYHGVYLAQHILGRNMSHPQLAQQVIDNWSTALKQITQGLKSQAARTTMRRNKVVPNDTGAEGGEGAPGEKKRVKEKVVLNRWPKSGTYGWQAMKVWRSCLSAEDLEKGAQTKGAVKAIEKGDAAVTDTELEQQAL